MEKRLKTNEAARQIGCCVKTLRTWIKKGIGPEYTEINGRKYFAESSIEKFITSHTKGAKA